MFCIQINNLYSLNDNLLFIELGNWRKTKIKLMLMLISTNLWLHCHQWGPVLLQSEHSLGPL